MRVVQRIFFGISILLLAVLSGPSLAQTTYKYDAAGRLTSVTEADGTRVLYRYDAAGNRTRRIVAFDNVTPEAGDDAIDMTSCAAPSLTFDPKVNDWDPEDEPLTIVSKTNGTQGAVTITGNELKYDRNAGASGADSFTYTIEDPDEDADTATVNVTLPPSANVNPAAGTDSGGQVPAQGTIYVSVLANDTDANCDTLSVTGAVSQSEDITAQVSGNQVQITHTGSSGMFLVPGSVSYSISDGRGGTANGTVNFSYWSSGL